MKERIKKIAATLKEGEGALILSEPNCFYLSGFGSSNGAVLITEKRAIYFTDFRYIEAARAKVQHIEVCMMQKLAEQIAAICTAEKVAQLLVETAFLSLSRYALMEGKLAPITLLRDDNRLDTALTNARAIKSDVEISAMRMAQKLTDDTFTYILERLQAGRTEREVALDMEFFMRRAGSEGVSFEFIVVSGKNSALPHGVPTDKPLEVGDFITMDFGAVVDGYRSDMTRTVALGRVDEEQRRVYETVLAAQSAALGFLRAGVTGGDADAVARDIITKAGYGECFGHSLGHSVGIEIHETPTCSPRATCTLGAGTVMTVEPGIYVAGKYGVRIEDMVVITEDGCQNLTGSPKQLIIV